jgi:hypothetical protein
MLLASWFLLLSSQFRLTTGHQSIPFPQYGPDGPSDSRRAAEAHGMELKNPCPHEAMPQRGVLSALTLLAHAEQHAAAEI